MSISNRFADKAILTYIIDITIDKDIPLLIMALPSWNQRPLQFSFILPQIAVPIARSNLKGF